MGLIISCFCGLFLFYYVALWRRFGPFVSSVLKYKLIVHEVIRCAYLKSLVKKV